MRLIKSSPAVLLLLLITACQKESPLQAPAPDGDSVAEDANRDFEAELEAKIQAHLAGSGLAKVNATEITGPTVITAPGIYRVKRSFSASADGIVIQSDFVILNLADHRITGPGNKTGRGIVLDGVSHVLVRNGDLRTFGTGVALLAASHSVVKNVDVQGGDEFADPPAGVPPQVGILLVNSNSNFIVGNEYEGINLGIFVRGGGSHNNFITRNSAEAGANGLLGVCYNPASGEGDAGPTNDFVVQNFLSRFGTGIQASSGSANNRFNHNRINYINKPWEDFNGTNEFTGNRTKQVSP
ncbi:MAG: NosD domain-containing protein [bacterium]